jgi:hypothetical protein
VAPACIGVAIGAVAAAATTHVMASLPFEVSPLDPLTYAAVALLLTLAAGARRAKRAQETLATSQRLSRDIKG